MYMTIIFKHLLLTLTECPMRGGMAGSASFLCVFYIIHICMICELLYLSITGYHTLRTEVIRSVGPDQTALWGAADKGQLCKQFCLHVLDFGGIS